MPKVSICIPTYNAAPYIEAAVRSVLDQTYRDFELLISDNGSTDGTHEILSRLAGTDPRIRYQRNAANLGSGRNFNKLWELAAGEYVNLFHADDLMLPHNVEVKVAVLDAYPAAGLVSSSTLSIDPEGNLLPHADNWEYPADLVLPAREWLRQNLGCNNTLCGTFAFMRRTVMRQVGPFNLDYTYAGDFDMWLRFALVSDTVLLKEVLGHYRRHPGSDSHRLHGGVRFRDACGIWSGILDALALPPDELREAEAKVAATLFQSIHNNVRVGNLDQAAELTPLLERWRGGLPDLLALAVRKLGGELAASLQELLRNRTEMGQLRAGLEIQARAIDKLKRARHPAPPADGAGAE